MSPEEWKTAQERAIEAAGGESEIVQATTPIIRYYSPQANGFYSSDAHPNPADRPEDCFEISHEEWDALMDANRRGEILSYEGGEITSKPRLITMDDIRATRDKKLRASDWSQGRDIPAETQNEWATYRQALRDIPETYDGKPDQVVWPETP